jgi:hypothetical protein
MSVSWPIVGVIAATVVWLGAALVSAFSRVPFPRHGLRRSEKALFASTLLLFGAWAAQLDFERVLGMQSAVRASALPGAAATTGSCASVATSMSESEVTSRLGKPDERRANEETRGPGSTILIYRASRCTVHLYDGKVDFVE